VRAAPLFAGFALAASVLAYGAAATAAQNCKLIRIDEWTVLPDIPTPVLIGKINGHPVGVLIDTGMARSEGAVLERALARQLGVPVMPNPDRELGGIGGESRAEIGLVSEVRIGEARRRNWLVLVGGEEHGQTGFFIIGNRFFQEHELEFDLSRQQVRLFKSEDCHGLSLAYWARSASVVPISVDKGWITLKVLLNGKPVVAVLDSGAATTILDASVLGRIGAESQLRSAAPGRCLRGFGKQAVTSQIGEFDSFTVGDELIRNPKIYFADLRKDVPRDRFLFFQIAVFEMPEMILGADFLRAHRVLISQPHGKLFFT
jgi:predicted aspartyl protease